MQVEVVRSAKRRKTVSARKLGGVVRVSIPATMTKAEEERWVGEMVRRIERQDTAAAIDLAARAATLAARYRLPVPTSIRWVDNQEFRWGSCTPADGTVRISTKVARFPAWVVDYVVVHELAHLVVSGHGRDFWDVVDRYPRAERAKGFLEAAALLSPGWAADPAQPDEPEPPAALPAGPEPHARPEQPELALFRPAP